MQNWDIAYVLDINSPQGGNYPTHFTAAQTSSMSLNWRKPHLKEAIELNQNEGMWTGTTPFWMESRKQHSPQGYLKTQEDSPCQAWVNFIMIISNFF